MGYDLCTGGKVMKAWIELIEDNCWIGAGVTICPDVHIGKNSVIDKLDMEEERRLR